jgi:hypothetical protein
MFRRKRKVGDFSAEIEAHIKLESERLREQGLTADEARAAACRTFGNVMQAEERFYESGRWLWWDHLQQDFRFGLRMLAKSPPVKRPGSRRECRSAASPALEGKRVAASLIPDLPV